MTSKTPTDAELDIEIDDKVVIFDSPTERLIHVHRGNIVANVRGEWTRPTILLAAQGQTPVFCHALIVKGTTSVVERPPGVHVVLAPDAEVTAFDADGHEIDLPQWALPTERSSRDD